MLKKSFRAFAFVFLLAVTPSCQLTEPTYKQIPPEQLAAISSRLKADIDTLLTERQNELMAALSEELGMTVQDVKATVVKKIGDVSGKVTEVKTVVAEIKPATEEAVEKVARTVVKNPGKPESWLGGVIAGAAVLAGGLAGLRGRRKKKEKPTESGKKKESASSSKYVVRFGGSDGGKKNG